MQDLKAEIIGKKKEACEQYDKLVVMFRLVMFRLQTHFVAAQLELLI